ncbi:molybdopterin molybdenumtransferase MoeA [Romboutsia weinsteinii]|uniref:Molybdopterin molybdenumtransferase n=1 Tax=Romboutsia weinsteinii TaxID=2020949 RepID=A0A371J333_9FIRM|nr:molybdopterin molybdotransferase MoeA [Romboutsia weinsteinii]RDY27200.1 molybdopterin molybdenumtransferase MoeA [Romboutsia weinsteinii]
MKLFDVVEVSSALDIMKKNFRVDIKVESVSLVEGLNRYTSKDIKSKLNVPHFRKSLVDGYAVLVRDVFLANESNPVPITIIGESDMGRICAKILDTEEAVYVPTGGMVPENAEAVVMIEYTEKLSEDTILVQKGLAHNENIVEVGEDIKEDEILYKKGHRINERDLGVLAGANIKEVEVHKKLVIGIISTGDEILNQNEDISEAKIKDINAYVLYGQLSNISCKPIIYPPVKDNLEEIIELIDRANKECDIVLISGGSSVGKKDETVRAIQSFKNSKVLVEGIAMKPGKPTIIAEVNKKLVLGLPGHPLSCAFVVEAILKPFILSLFEEKSQRYLVCEFKYNYHKAKGREEYLAVDISEEGGKLLCTPILAKSSMIKHFANCDGYIRIDRDLEGIHKGESVKVNLF